MTAHSIVRQAGRLGATLVREMVKLGCGHRMVAP
jgi:hypothetical protein